jgi:hypothetical protein
LEKSFKFKNIESNLTKLFMLIYENQNINKYIYYLNDDPLSFPTVPVDLYENGNFILGFYDGSIPTEEKIRFFLNVSSGNLAKHPMDKIVYPVQVVIPSRWEILHGRGEIRAIRIFDEISQMVDQQKVAGMTEAEVINYRAGRMSGTEYSIFTVEIVIKSATTKGLR